MSKILLVVLRLMIKAVLFIVGFYAFGFVIMATFTVSYISALAAGWSAGWSGWVAMACGAGSMLVADVIVGRLFNTSETRDAN